MCQTDKAVISFADSVTSTWWDGAAIGQWGAKQMPDDWSFTPEDYEEGPPAVQVGDTQWGSEYSAEKFGKVTRVIPG